MWFMRTKSDFSLYCEFQKLKAFHKCYRVESEKEKEKDVDVICKLKCRRSSLKIVHFRGEKNSDWFAIKSGAIS